MYVGNFFLAKNLETRIVVISIATVILKPYAASILSEWRNNKTTPIHPAHQSQLTLGTYNCPFCSVG